MAKAAATGGEKVFVIPPPKIEAIRVAIQGVSPLIVHAWSEKARRMMLDKQQKKAKGAKEPKDPEADYLSSRYISTEGWDGAPAPSIKAAIVGACRAVDGLPMTLAKRMCFVRSEGVTKAGIPLIRIHGAHRMREDMVRLETGVADIRFRAEYPEWRADLTIEFNAGVISADQIINLVSLAGYSEGICEWRPSAPKSSTGEFGRWRVV